jgi:O-antigen/teichoic acid export membrane protein
MHIRDYGHLANSMNLKLLGKDTVIYAIGNIAVRGASFLVIPLYTYGLSIEDFGRLATLLLSIQILIIFMELGSKKAFIRFASERNKQVSLGMLLTSSVLINIIGGLGVSVIVITFLQPLFQNLLNLDDISKLVTFTCATALVQSICIHLMAYYLINKHSIKYVMLSMAIPALLIVFNLWLLLYLDKGIEGALIAQILAYAIVALLIVFDILTRHAVLFSLDLMRRLFFFGGPLIFAASGDLITEAAGIYMLGYFSGLKDVAIFSLGYKIAQISYMVLILPFQLAYEPFVFNHMHRPNIKFIIGRLLSYLMLAYAFVACFIVFVFRDLFHVIAPVDYSAAYGIIFLLLPGMAFKGVYYVGESLLHIKNMTRVTGSVVFAFSVLGIMCDFIFISLFGIYGAIIAVSAVNVLLPIVIMSYGIRAFPIILEPNRLAINVVLCLVLLASVFLMYEANSVIYYTLVPAMMLVCTVCLYVSGFFDEGEKHAIVGALSDIRSMLKTQTGI